MRKGGDQKGAETGDVSEGISSKLPEVECDRRGDEKRSVNPKHVPAAHQAKALADNKHRSAKRADRQGETKSRAIDITLHRASCLLNYREFVVCDRQISAQDV